MNRPELLNLGFQQSEALPCEFVSHPFLPVLSIMPLGFVNAGTLFLARNPFTYVSTFCNLCSARNQSGMHRREERSWEPWGRAACGGSGVAPDNSSLLGSYLALPLVSCLKYSFSSFQSHFSSCYEFPTLPVVAAEIFQACPTCSKCCQSCFFPWEELNTGFF